MLQFCSNKADFWPYDLDYIAVTIPPPYWSTAKYAAWLLLQAFDNGLANVRLRFPSVGYDRSTRSRFASDHAYPISDSTLSIADRGEADPLLTW